MRAAGVQAGDIMALKRQGGNVLVKGVKQASSAPAAAAAATPVPTSARAAARPAPTAVAVAGPSSVPRQPSHLDYTLSLPTTKSPYVSLKLRSLMSTLSQIIPSFRCAQEDLCLIGTSCRLHLWTQLGIVGPLFVPDAFSESLPCFCQFVKHRRHQPMLHAGAQPLGTVPKRG